MLSHNKTLAAQLCAEFREFFGQRRRVFRFILRLLPAGGVYPREDLYIEKDALINDEIDKLRHGATSALFERRDVIIVASVSCIHSLGDPATYAKLTISLRPGMTMERDDLIQRLIAISYERNDINFTRDKFRVRGDVVEILPASSTDKAIRVEFFGDEIERVSEINIVTGEVLRELRCASIFPATHYAIEDEKREQCCAK